MTDHCKGILAQPRLPHPPDGWTQQRGEAGADVAVADAQVDADADRGAGADADPNADL